MNRRVLVLLSLSLLVVALSACFDDDKMKSPDFVTELRLELPDGSQTTEFEQGSDARVVLLVRNRDDHSQTLTFNDQRTSDFVVLDSLDNPVRLWSSQLVTSPVVTTVTIAAGETRRFEMEWEGLENDNGNSLSAGEYEVQGWLPARGEDGTDDLRPGPLRSTLVPFTITPAN